MRLNNDGSFDLDWLAAETAIYLYADLPTDVTLPDEASPGLIKAHLEGMFEVLSQYYPQTVSLAIEHSVHACHEHRKIAERERQTKWQKEANQNA